MTPFLRDWPGPAARRALMLHCSMGASGYWAPFAEALGDVIAIRAVDAPGHGRSPDWAPDGPDFHSLYTRWAVDQIDGPVDLTGHSLGATVALRIAVERPDAVRSLTLIEPVLFAAAPEWLRDPVFVQVDALTQAGRMEEATRVFVDTWGAAPFDTRPAEHRARMVAQMRLVQNSNIVLAFDRPGLLAPGRIEAIAAPALVIASDSSHPSIAAVSAALAARLPDARLATVAGGGHMLPLTRPAEIAALIRGNLDRA